MNRMLLLKGFRWLLRLYPRRFHEEYAEEMQIVFELALDEARRIGAFALAKALFRELMMLPLMIMKQHLREKLGTYRQHVEATMIKSATPSQIRFVRWLTRLFGLLAALFFLDILLRILPNNPHLLPLTVAFAVTVASILLAWRLERIGGLATILCSILVALCGMYGTYAYEQALGQPVAWVILLAGLLWGFPFLAVGWLFISVNRAAKSLVKYQP